MKKTLHRKVKLSKHEAISLLIYLSTKVKLQKYKKNSTTKVKLQRRRKIKLICYRLIRKWCTLLISGIVHSKD